MDEIDELLELLLAAQTQAPRTVLELPEAAILELCSRSRLLLLSQPVLAELVPPLKICGDIHGQYTDLLRLFEMGGFPSVERPYLFLGDYVDRAQQSIETACLLLCYKLKFPEHVVLLRGNHECSSINRVYGFYDECKRRYNLKLWRAFCCVFDCLPIACVIAERIFCVHGGLSPSLHRMEQLLRVKRPLTVGDCGMVCDLLWSDPDPDVSGWAESGRGVSYQFGPSVIDAFLEKHDFDLIVRAHQVVEDGYEFFHGRKLVTVFSAPNYCNEFDNLAAMMVIDAQLHCSFLVLAPKS